MNITNTTDLESLEDIALREIVQGNTAFTESMLLSMPELAADTAFDPYDQYWLRRYWKRIILEVKDDLTEQAVLSWALGTTAGALANLLAQQFNLPEIAMPAAVALAILIMRQAKEYSLNPEPDNSPETIAKDENPHRGDDRS